MRAPPRVTSADGEDEAHLSGHLRVGLVLHALLLWYDERATFLFGIPSTDGPAFLLAEILWLLEPREYLQPSFRGL